MGGLRLLAASTLDFIGQDADIPAEHELEKVK